MGHTKKKRRRQKPTAQARRLQNFTETIVSGIISSLITAAIIKLLDW